MMAVTTVALMTIAVIVMTIVVISNGDSDGYSDDDRGNWGQLATYQGFRSSPRPAISCTSSFSSAIQRVLTIWFIMMIIRSYMEIIIIIVVNSLSPLRRHWGQHFPFFLLTCIEYEWEILNVSGKYWVWVRNIEHERELLDTSGKYWIQNIHIQRWWSSFFVSRCLEYEREILEVFNERIPTKRVVSQ